MRGITILDKNGNPAPDGEYKDEKGNTIIIVDGEAKPFPISVLEESFTYTVKRQPLKQEEIATKNIEFGAEFMLIAEEDGKHYYPSAEYIYVLPDGTELALYEDENKTKTFIGSIGFRVTYTD